MKTFSSVIALLVSVGAIALSGLTYFKVSTLEKQLPEQIALTVEETLAASSPSSFAEPDATENSADNNAVLSSETTTDEDVANSDTGSSAVTAAEQSDLAQFSQLAFNNTVQIQLVSVQRLSEAETGSEGIVNVNLRVKRAIDLDELEQSDGPSSINFTPVKGRNPRTNAVYSVKGGKRTNSTGIRKLSSEAWSEAYFWLEDIPEGVQTIDIVFPDTAIMEGVPISD
ncbi:MAG: hypothetical protein AAFP09_04260 [Cyanobacteria bacterium J06607_10]